MTFGHGIGFVEFSRIDFFNFKLIFYSHGIGHFLAVHEGPQRIGPTYNPYEEPLADGMFLSDEPGFYKPDDFGIRIENDMEVVMTDKSVYDGTQFLRFNTITLVPYERSLIDISLLTTAQRNAIDQYHAQVSNILEPLLKDDQAALNALRSRTAKLGPEPVNRALISISSPVLIISMFILNFLF